MRILLLAALLAQDPWPLETPFHELAERILSRKTTPSDRADLRKLVDLMEADRLPGPWWDEVRVATSKDGRQFSDLRTTAIRRASVPEAVVDSNGHVWLFYVDSNPKNLLHAVEEDRPFKTGLIGIGGLAAAKSEDGNRFAPVEIEIANAVQGEIVDPDIVLGADGVWRLYYLGVPAKDLAPDTPDPARSPGRHRFYLATSKDLVHWEQQGVAWTGPHGGADPAVYRTGDGTYFILGGGSGRSSDGGRTFSETRMSTGRWGQPDVVPVDGGFRLFYSTRAGIRSAFSSDGTAWKEEEGVRFREGADPSVVRMKDGSWRMYYKVKGRR